MKPWLIALIMLASFQASAGTAVLYPQYSYFQAGPSSGTFGGTFKVPPTEAFSQNWGTKSGWFWQSPNVGSLAATSRMSAADAQAINRAITGVAKASQSAAKIVAGGILSAGVFALGAWALEQGFEYVSGVWLSTSPSANLYYPPGSSTGVACPDPWNGTKPEWSPRCVPVPEGIGIYSTNGFCTAPPAAPCFTYYGWTSSRIVPTPSVFQQSASTARDLTDSELADMVRLGYAVPVNAPPATVIGDFSALTAAELAILTSMGYFQQSPVTVNNGAPYIDPITGQKMQPKLTAEPAPNGGVRVTSSDQPVDANGEPTKKEDGSDEDPTDSKDPCAENPDTVACSSLGSLDPAGDPTPLSRSLSFTPGTLATAGSCPAPRTFSTFGHTISMSYDPICNAASTYIKPFVLLASALVSSFIFVGGLKS